MPSRETVALIRGVGDIGSAIAHALHSCGWQVVIHDDPAPATPRRGMAFTDAMFEGQAVLAGTAARRVDQLERLTEPHHSFGAVIVTALPFAEVLTQLQPAVLVDARMRKTRTAENQRGLAPRVFGIGPGFVAGATVDVVIESARGPRLGMAIHDGAADSRLGEPAAIAGFGRRRFVYAPEDGRFVTEASIGQRVGSGEIVAAVGGQPIRAPLDGEIRGLSHDGAAVYRSAKVLEVVPVGAAPCFGIGGRPASIAVGVLSCINGEDRRGPVAATS